MSFFEQEAAAPLTRVFMDPDGNEWQVTEEDGTLVPATRGRRCLIFRSNQVIRRVWNYPTTWADLGTPDLIRVSWNR